MQQCHFSPGSFNRPHFLMTICMSSTRRVSITVFFPVTYFAARYTVQFSVRAPQDRNSQHRSVHLAGCIIAFNSRQCPTLVFLSRLNASWSLVSSLKHLPCPQLYVACHIRCIQLFQLQYCNSTVACSSLLHVLRCNNYFDKDAFFFCVCVH